MELHWLPGCVAPKSQDAVNLEADCAAIIWILRRVTIEEG